MKVNCIFLALLIAFCFTSCRKDPEIFLHEEVPVTHPQFISIQGFYLLNEGNMGQNKSTLDYFDYEEGVYYRNIYGEANPSVPKELGDVGNDLAIYGNKLYAVINCSNKIEVMDAKTAERIGQIDIPNCRYITFYNGFAYVTSYAGPVTIDPDYQQIGYIAKIDTTSLQILDKCLVGLQPDGLAIANGKIYVANSGGYLSPNYENTVSVIDAASFKEIKQIKVAVNLHRVCADKNGNIWVNTRGDYFNTSSKLYCIDSKTDQLTDSINIAVSNFHLDDDRLYIIGVKWNYETMSNEINYGIVDVVSKQIITKKFITDGTDINIKTPYGIIVNPITKDIYVTDVKNYISPGTLYCFDKNGKQKWNVSTGDIPAHIAFIGKYKSNF
ncbi:MAG: YncE family protein [Bacteroidetes bacterium]|nr:YncE family protein [Bacteroidota bacterium]MCL2302161.1 YncE family protein [Lentimicrobiaceae bacterium]